MPLQVIGAGLGRTGTLSLKHALEALGFDRCYHMVEVFGRMEDVESWTAAARGEPVDWDRLFEGYRSIVDWPGCAFYRELLRQYPEARVILSVRDPESWYDSAYETIYHVRKAMPAGIPTPSSPMHAFREMTDRIIWDGMFQGRFEDRSFAIDAFNRHNDEVRREVPADRLLVYQVREGWEPLCSFLGVPVPEGKPFPRVNDAEEFRARLTRAASPGGLFGSRDAPHDGSTSPGETSS